METICIIIEVTSSNFYNGKNSNLNGLERKFCNKFSIMINVNYKKMKFIKYEYINNDFTIYSQ